MNFHNLEVYREFLEKFQGLPSLVVSDEISKTGENGENIFFNFCGKRFFSNVLITLDPNTTKDGKTFSSFVISSEGSTTKIWGTDTLHCSGSNILLTSDNPLSQDGVVLAYRALPEFVFLESSSGMMHCIVSDKMTQIAEFELPLIDLSILVDLKNKRSYILPELLNTHIPDYFRVGYLDLPFNKSNKNARLLKRRRVA